MLIRVRTIFILMFVFSFNVVLLANKSTNKYFPGTLDSYWVYEDQDGNEFTRRAIEGEEIAGKTFPAFSYEPELEDWTEYSPFIQPSLYNVSDAGITLVVGDEVEKAVKARLSKEMELVREIFTIQQPDDTDFNYEIKVEAHNHSYLLPTPVVLNEEWDVNNIKASLALDLQGNDQVKIDFTIIETGIVLDTETVETAAGKFEDCLKVEYRTETTAIISPIPSPDEIDPPGETVTTVWFAPNVGIVKVHQKMNYMFFDMVKDDGGLPKPPDPEPITFELKKYEIKTAEPEIKTAVPDSDDSDDSDDSNLGNESNPKYFPDTLESFWIYEDQDGNELTRRAIEGEEIAGKTFPASSYEPELKDWVDYSCFIRPSLYQVSDAGITLVVGDEVEKAVKARLSKEMESFREIIRRDDPDSANFTYNIEVEAQGNSNLLPTPVTLNEEWDTNEIKASLALIFEGEEQIKIDYTIMETGIVKGTETVVAAAGTFEDCLKVEYRTETTAALDPAELPDEMDPPGETVTTVWFAPDVGIVKFHQKMNYMFFDMFQDEFQDDGGLEKPPDPEPKTFELKKYEIKTAEPEIKTAVPDSDDSDDSDDSNLGNESDSKYFPDTLESFWIYEDQDGNELTRRAIEGEEVAGKTFSAFSYEPELKDWAEYSPFIQPSLYNVSDAGITLVVSDEVEKAVKARLSKEMKYLREMLEKNDPDRANFTYNIKAEAHKHSYLLPTPVVLNEEWDVNQIKASLALDLQRDEPLTTDYTINETGIIRGTETIKTAAGTFEDCLKVEYRTETTVIITPVPSPDEVDPPGETVTTVWFAPNVGIVKFNQKMNYTFLDMIKDDGGLEKPPDPEPKTFELKKYEIKTAEPKIKTAVPDSDDNNLGNESDPKYFPDALDSFWVYEDQDGNELTRRAIEGEEIAGKTFPAFSYEPELEDWTEYSPFIHPSLYNVSDAGITLVVGDEVEKAVKARLSEEMESLREIIRRDDPDSANFTYNIEVEAQDNSNLLPTPVTLNEEWDTNEIKASLALIFEGEEQIKIDYTIMETGIVKGTETVVAAAGTFEDCLKVEYRTETTAVLDPAELPDEMDPPGETVTTVWFAPDVGIVKFHQKMNYMFFDMFQDEFQDDGGLEKPPDPEPITFELKKYEIKAAEPEN